MLTVIMITVIMLTVITLNDVMLIVIMLTVSITSVVMLAVVLLSVVMLSVTVLRGDSLYLTPNRILFHVSKINFVPAFWRKRNHNNCTKRIRFLKSIFPQRLIDTV